MNCHTLSHSAKKQKKERLSKNLNCLKSHKPSTENKKQKLSPEHLNGVKKEGNISFHNYCKTNKNGQKACQKKKNKKLKFSDFNVFQEVNKEVASIEFQNFFFYR